MTNVISRWECPVCGGWTEKGNWREPHTRGDIRRSATTSECPGVPVERRYIAEDVLRNDAVLMAVMEVIADQFGASSNVSAERCIVAAIEAAKGVTDVQS